MDLNLETTGVFEENYNSKERIIINRGGSRSSKTYSLIQLFILKALTEPNKRIIISRVSHNVMKSSIIKEMKEMISFLNLESLFKFNATYSYFTSLTTKSTIEFISCDEPDKWKGLEANYFWFNEADGIRYEFFKQAIMRLSRKSEDNKINQFFLDFNPSNPVSWVRKEIEEKRTDIKIIKSTYLDNPFLTIDDINEINNWKDKDYDFWLCYAQGEYGEVKGAVFKNWEIVNELSYNDKTKKLGVGLDFGFTNDPSSAVMMWRRNDYVYIKELFYKKGLTNPDIAVELKKHNVSYDDLIIADSAEPKSIEELKRLGFRNIKPVKKGKNSINLGIDILKRFKLRVIKPSTNLITELNNYTWVETKDGTYLNKPKDEFNHCLDAVRYVALEKMGIKPSGSGIKIRTL